MRRVKKGGRLFIPSPPPHPNEGRSHARRHFLCYHGRQGGGGYNAVRCTPSSYLRQPPIMSNGNLGLLYFRDRSHTVIVRCSKKRKYFGNQRRPAVSKPTLQKECVYIDPMKHHTVSKPKSPASMAAKQRRSPSRTSPISSRKPKKRVRH